MLGFCFKGLIYYLFSGANLEKKNQICNSLSKKNAIDELFFSFETEIPEVMRSLDVRPRQLSRVTGMNYETIRNIAKKLP
jgi:hypothetical protein